MPINNREQSVLTSTSMHTSGNFHPGLWFINYLRSYGWVENANINYMLILKTVYGLCSL